MAIKLYAGVSGSGKSYEVVTEVIAEALKRGRRVVSNVSGVNADRIKEDVTGPDCPPNKFGHYVQVTNEQIRAEDFFCTEFQRGFVQFGDLVVIDECWRFWPDQRKISERQFEFFREHRHYAHPDTGVTCDLVLISQLVKDITPAIRGNIEMTCRMAKLKELGLDSWYTVEIFNCAPGIRTKPLRVLKRQYDPAKFEWYSSYKGKGEELEVDGRQNIFKGAFFKFILPLVALLMVGGIWAAKSYLDRGSKPKDVAAKTAPKDGKPAARGEVSPPAKPPGPDMSKRWKVQGYMMGSGVIVYLTDGSVSRIADNPGVYKLSGRIANIKIESDEWVTTWSGSSSSRPSSPLP